MAGPHTRPHVRLLVGAVALVVLALLAAIADSRAVAGTPVFTTLDIAVGCIFVGAAVMAVGDDRERLLFGAVGPAWLAGSVLPAAQSLHQSMLAIALLAFPTGRIRGNAARLLALCAAVVMFQLVPQLGVAAVFAAVSVVALAQSRHTPTVASFPAAAGTTVAAALLFSWWAVRHSAAISPLVLYECALVTVAVGFPFATRSLARSRAMLADMALGDRRFAGLPGLELVLASLLADPQLRVDPWHPETNSYLPRVRQTVPAEQSSSDLLVFDGDQLLGRVTTSSSAVLDGPTAEGVAAAVRLTLVNRRLRDVQAQRVADEEASRRRLLAAADRERERIAGRLRMEAGEFLECALAELGGLPRAPDVETSAAIELAAAEVATAAGDISAIVSGVPATPLGCGRLAEALRVLAERSPVPVTLDIGDGTAAEAAVETTLFYVCSEAFTNVAKHADASQVVIHLRREDEKVFLRVHDDGRGGADPAGSGLRGLAARLAVAGGEFSLHSAPGAGTTVTAAVRAKDVAQVMKGDN